MRLAVVAGSQATPEMRLPWVAIQSDTSARALAAASSVPAARMWRSQRKPCSDFSQPRLGDLDLERRVAAGLDQMAGEREAAVIDFERDLRVGEAQIGRRDQHAFRRAARDSASDRPDRRADAPARCARAPCDERPETRRACPPASKCARQLPITDSSQTRPACLAIRFTRASPSEKASAAFDQPAAGAEPPWRRSRRDRRSRNFADVEIGRRGAQRAAVGRERRRCRALRPAGSGRARLAGVLGKKRATKLSFLRPDRASSWKRRGGRRASPASPPPRAVVACSAASLSMSGRATSSRARQGDGARCRCDEQGASSSTASKSSVGLVGQDIGLRRSSACSRSRSRLPARRVSRFFDASTAVTSAPASTSCAVLPPGAAQRSATRLAGDIAEQPRGQAGGGVLHPPLAPRRNRAGRRPLPAQLFHAAREPVGSTMPPKPLGPKLGIGLHR